MRKIKKILAFLLVLTCVLSNAVSAEVFTDISENNYSDAIEVLSSLSLMYGYEDGSFKPENYITRAEYAVMMTRILGISDGWIEADKTFPDVPDSHWAYLSINYLYNMEYLNGFEDGSFRPEAPVSMQEAIKVLIDVLGYKIQVSDIPYPTGYLAKAKTLGLQENLGNVDYSGPALRGAIAQLIYNAIDVPVYKLTSVTGETAIYKEGRDFLYEYLKIYRYEGTVISNDVTSLSGNTEIGDGKICIKEKSTGNKIIFNTGDIQADKLLSYNVLAFAKKENDQNILISIIKAGNNNDELVVSADQYISCVNRELKYYTNADTKDKERSVRVLFGADLIYNGAYIPFDEAAMSIPTGNIRLIDSENDGIYDIIIIDTYSLTVVDRVSSLTKTVIDRYSASDNIIYDGSGTLDKN